MSKKNKVALVTGSSKRIGAAIIRSLHQNQIDVIIHHNNSKRDATKLEKELNQMRANSASMIDADLLKINNFKSFINKAIKIYGRLDFLIHNASTYYPTPLGSIKESQWHDLVGVNLKIPLFLSQAAAKELEKNHGSIINISDANYENPKEGYSVYSLAKAGLVSLTKSLAQEMAPKVRVNSVAPGPIIWPDANKDFTASYKTKVISQTLLKKIGAPEDIAKAVVYLLLHAPYVTGQVLAVDGGRSV